MPTLIWDTETNGLLPTMDKVHVLSIEDYETGELVRYVGKDVVNGLRRLMEADRVVGHNIIGFDIPAMQLVYPWFSLRQDQVLDTMILARLLWPDIKTKDFDRVDFPKKLIGTYKLEAFGHRLKLYKGDYTGGWESYSEEMGTYCDQDVRVTSALFKRCLKEMDEWGNPYAIQLEHKVAFIVERQVRHGVLFDQAAAAELYSVLMARKQILEDELQKVFPPEPYEFIPKATNAKYGYMRGVPVVKHKVFNPGSRDQVAARLKQWGWEPEEFTDSGKPTINDEILANLPYADAKPLAEYYMLDKRISQLATGDEAWLKHIRKGRIHGGVVTNGAVTGRMTHRGPNLAQVPSVSAPYGKECRALFIVPAGYKLVGCDADSLEMRCLAHFMARYDEGEFISILLTGRKEDKTDQHTLNSIALGCSRDTAKTWFYAFIYGAQDHKLGVTLGVTGSAKKIKAAGKESREKFLAKFPALAEITKAVTKKGKRVGYIVGLDGRRLYIRSFHAALNTVLQSAGALLMKQALVILDEDLQTSGLKPGTDYEFVLNIHDEWQIEVREEHAESVSKLAEDSIKKAGEFFNFRCPVKGNSDIGNNWKDTH